MILENIYSPSHRVMPNYGVSTKFSWQVVQVIRQPIRSLVMCYICTIAFALKRKACEYGVH